VLKGLTFVLAIAAPIVQVDEATQIDARVLRHGLEVRLGAAARDWEVEVRPTATPDVLHVRLRSPQGDEVHRSFLLEEEEAEGRSRELASATAFIIESHREEHEPTVPEAPDDGAPRGPLLGWVGLGARVGLGPISSPDPDGGISARGGLWLVRDHVQPIVSLGWSRSMDGDLVLHAVRAGAGAAFGAGLERLWVGAGVVPHATWTRAADRAAVTGWRSSTEIAALLQVRGRWGLLGVRAGVDLTLPPVRAVGSETDLRWGPARFLLGLEFGLVVPPKTK
jgi:hypothetical protein